MGITVGIFFVSIVLKEMRYLVYIRYLWTGSVNLARRGKLKITFLGF
jgi:hypothetical protein